MDQLQAYASTPDRLHDQIVKPVSDAISSLPQDTAPSVEVGSPLPASTDGRVSGGNTADTGKTLGQTVGDLIDAHRGLISHPDAGSMDLEGFINAVHPDLVAKQDSDIDPRVARMLEKTQTRWGRYDLEPKPVPAKPYAERLKPKPGDVEDEKLQKAKDPYYLHPEKLFNPVMPKAFADTQ